MAGSSLLLRYVSLAFVWISSLFCDMANLLILMRNYEGRGKGGRHRVERFQWISQDAAVLHCFGAMEARKLFADLRCLNPGGAGNLVLSGGVRCHVQWCSTSASDLAIQIDVIERVEKMRFVKHLTS